MKTPSLQTRQDNLHLLRSTGTAFRWNPILVDAALDLPFTPPSVHALVYNPAFQANCHTLFAAYTSIRDVVGGDFSRLLEPETDTLSQFYFSVLRRACSIFKGQREHRGMREEMLAYVRFQHIRHVHRFLPGMTNADGSETTWGLKAFLEDRVPFMARAEYFRSRGQQARTESLDDPAALRPERSGGVPIFDQMTLEAAVRHAITTNHEAELVWRFVGLEQGLVECAGAYHCSQAKIHGQLREVFARLALGLGAPAGIAPNVDRCRKALASMIPPSTLQAWLSPALARDTFRQRSRDRNRGR